MEPLGSFYDDLNTPFINSLIDSEKKIEITLLPKADNTAWISQKELDLKELDLKEKKRIKEYLEPIVLESFEIAFNSNFLKSKKMLHAKKKATCSSSLEKKELLTQINKRIQFIEKIEKIALWPPLKCCKCLSVKDYKEEAKKAWIRSISLNSEEMIMPRADLLTLIRIGVDKQWFVGQDFYAYKNLLQIFISLMAQQEKKIIFSEVLANACIQLKQHHEAERIRDKCLKPLLTENIKQTISNLLDVTFEFQDLKYPHLVTRTYKIIFDTLKTIPFEFNLCLIVFRQMLLCIKNNLSDTKWALSEMETFVKDIEVEGVAADEKAELLKIIQQDVCSVYLG